MELKATKANTYSPLSHTAYHRTTGLQSSWGGKGPLNNTWTVYVPSSFHFDVWYLVHLPSFLRNFTVLSLNAFVNIFLLFCGKSHGTSNACRRITFEFATQIYVRCSWASELCPYAHTFLIFPAGLGSRQVAWCDRLNLQLHKVRSSSLHKPALAKMLHTAADHAAWETWFLHECYSLQKVLANEISWLFFFLNEQSVCATVHKTE